MSSFAVSIAGLEVTVLEMRNSGLSAKDAAAFALKAAGKVLFRQVRKRMSLRDHSLADLAQMGHPYAKRWPTIKVHTKLPWQVHRQSEDNSLRDALKGEFSIDGAGMHYDVFVDLNQAPHGEYVIGGTKVMHPRDVIWESSQEPKVNDKMMREIVKVLGKKLRSKSGLRFTTRKPTILSMASTTGDPTRVGAVGIR